MGEVKVKYNIAICGTFNIENYGDVMFPEIFKRSMQKRNFDCELFLISPGKTVEETLCPNTKVYSVSELDMLHKKYGLNAIVIGGGALIHYNKIPVKLPNENDFSQYNIYDSWFTPIEFAIRNNIKVLFNLPQIPYDFPEQLYDVTEKAFQNIDYISLRDSVSSEKIKAIFAENSPSITVCPDSVCCMCNVLPPEELLPLKQKLLQFDEEYAVIQFNMQKSNDDDENLLKIINELQSRDYKIVLLPLGYTHNDDNVLKQYRQNCNKELIVIDKKLNIFEMAAILSGASIYIGSSFHGAITAISYGNVAVSYNYIYPKTKNREVFEMYGISDFVGENAEEVYDIIKKYFCGDLNFKPNINDVVSKVEKHFDKLCELISTPKNNAADAYGFYSSLIELLPQNVELYKKNKLLMEKEKLTLEHIGNLEAILKSEKNKSDLLAISNQKLKKDYDNLCRQLDEIKEKYNSLGAEHNKLENEYNDVKDKYDDIKDDYEFYVDGYNQIQKSFFWRLTYLPRRLLQFIKNRISRNTKMLKLAIYMKGFLRGGFKGARKQLDAYNHFLSNNSPSAIRVSKQQKFTVLSKTIREQQENSKFSRDIKFSILVPLYNTPKDFLVEMINSVKEQTYKNWELCLADGSTQEFDYVQKMCVDFSREDSRIVYKKLEQNLGISENTNACLNMATGDYIALFDHDDILDPTVLFEYMKAICEQDADFVYCDEDKFNKFGGELYDPNYKPDFAVDNLRSNNYICHFTVFDKKLIDKAGAFRKEFDGSQDHDLILRLTEQAKNIVHIPKILYHWRVSEASVASDPYAKPYTIEAGKKAVSEHLERLGIKGIVESTKIHPNIYRVKYDIIGNPLVSIIIPNYNHIEELSRCIDSIINKSTYKNYEIIIVENNSDKKTFEYYETLKKFNNIKVVVYKTDGGFNYSAINNYGVKFAKGEHYILLNNDVEIITPNWIEEMLMYSQRDDVGAVGAMLYYPNDTIQHAGVTIGVLTLAGHNFKHLQRGNPGYFGRAGYQQNVSAVTAACLMLSAKVYKEVNGLDESFAVAFNDIDFCMRIRKAGYLISFTPFAELYHYESISRGSDEAPEKRARFVSEVERFQERWAKELEAGDPYYNPNLTLEREDFSLK